ncbi:MAG: thiamine phosphate synthase, partial [Hydrocarboniphaga effusa]|nr:thiamine phosphate synthase [Hydrocarboniphaga effusa]
GARGAVAIPICAIGGIPPQNAAPLIAAGAGLLAVVGGLFDAPDIKAAAQDYSRLFQ